jgi:polyferredoxin
MKKRKISVMQIIRHACQLAAFIIYPGLFVSVFLAVKDIYTALISGKFAWSVQAPSVFLIIAVFLVTIIFGRFFCGFICSFGAMGDLMWFISSHTLKPRFRVSSQADRILKYLKYAVLLVIVLIGWTFAVFDFDGYSSPWTVFAMAASVKSWSQPTFLLTVGALLLLIIIAGSLLIERFFCRYLCPLGALFCLTSRIRLFRIRKPRRKCDKCSLCTYKCSMGIPLGETDIVKSGECIDCFACTDVCPKGNATANQAPIVTAAVAIAAMSGMMIYVGKPLYRCDGTVRCPECIGSSSSGGTNCFREY